MKIDEIYKGAAPEQMKLAHEIHNETVKSEEDWIAELRSMGIKAAHWNNGYVDRVNNVLDPHGLFFNDGVSVGDLIAIGNPPEWYSPNKVAHRIVRVVDTLPSLGYRKVDRWVFAPMPGEPDIRETMDKQSWYGSLVAAQNARELADRRRKLYQFTNKERIELLRAIGVQAGSAETVGELIVKVAALCGEHGLNYSHDRTKPNFFEFYKDAERIGDLTFADRPFGKKPVLLQKTKDGFRKLKKLLARMGGEK